LTIQEAFETIKTKILRVYPTLTISFDEDTVDDEYWISIHNSTVYFSDEFLGIVYEINTELLWPNGLYNVFVSNG